MIDPTVRKDIIAKVDSIERIHREVEESLKVNYTHLRSSKDSIEKKLDQVRKALESRQHSTQNVIEKVKESYQKNDTIGQVSACNELVDQAVALSEQVDAYKTQNDSLKAVNDSLQSLAGQRLQSQLDLNAGLVRSFDQLKSEYDKQAAAYQKSVNKNNRKYTVAIGGGAGLTTEGKPAGMIGIFVGRDVFKF